MPDPTPAAAAATPAVLPLSAERQKHVLHVCASRGDVDYCDECFDEWPCRVALLGMLDAARADLAEFARQTREAQAAMMAAILDKEQERQAREQVEIQAEEWALSSHRNRESLAACEIVLVQERNQRRWAETRASHWRREWYLTMDTLGVRSNELGRAHMAHRTALAQERQAREQAERERDMARAVEFAAIGVANQENSVAVDLTLYVRRLKQAVEEADAKATRWGDEDGEFVAAYGLPVGPWHRLLAVARDEPTPASPALEPADQTAAQAQGE